MSDATHGMDPQLLLAQATWVRGLAARLLEDEHAAEDVVQDTWLAALQRGPGKGAPGEVGDRSGLRPWLAVVARNIALKRRRGDLARRDRERRVAEPEAIAPDDEVERLRQQQSLAEAVLGLSDPYRSTLVLRYFDGLSTHAIARKRGVSQAAVRQHVSRGLRMLKARLDCEYGGDRSVWTRAFVGLAGNGAGSPFWWTSLIAGSGLMGIKWVVGSVGLVGAVLLSVSIWSGPEALQGPGTALERLDPGPVSMVHASTPSPAVDVDVPRLDSPAPSRSDLAHTGPVQVHLSGQVLDVDGRGLPGAWVRWAGASESASPQAVTTDDLGEFALAFDQALVDGPRVTLQSGCEGFVSVVVELVPGAEHSITLLRLPALSGRVLDPHGEPAEPPGRVQLTIVDRGSLEEFDFEAELEPGGLFAHTGLPVGRLVRASALVRGAPELELDLGRELEPQAQEELELQLAPGVVVVGTVLDDSTGLPVEGASVWADTVDPDGGGLRPMALSDELGRFELRGVKPSPRSTDAGHEFIVVWVLASAPGYTSTPTRAFAAGKDSPQPYDFELRMAPSPCSLTGLVRGALARDPVPGAHVHAIDSQGGYEFTQADADGRFAFTDLPAGNLALTVRHGELADPGGNVSARLQVVLEAGYQESVELTLMGPGATGIEGRVQDASGSSVAGMRVTARQHFSANGIAIELDSKSVHTDSSGRYAIEGLSPAPYAVSPDLPRGQELSVSPGSRRLDLERDQWASSVDFRIGPGVRFGGRVIGGGGPLTRYHVEIYAADSSAEAAPESLAETRVGEEGGFSLPPLLGDLYELRILLGERIIVRRSVGPAASSDLLISLEHPERGN